MTTTKKTNIYLIIFIILFLCNCSNQSSTPKTESEQSNPENLTKFEKGMYFYLKSGYENYLRSLQVFKQLVNKKHDYALGYAMISLNYSRIGQVHFLNKKVPKAKVHYKKALQYALYSLKLNKKLARGYTALALYARQIQNWPNMINFAKKAIQFNNQEYEAYSILGDGYNPFFFDSRSDTQKSVLYYEKSLTISPYFIPSCFNLSILNFNRRKYQKVIYYLKRALKKNNHLPQFYYYLAISYRKLGQYPLALVMITKGIKLMPDNAFYHFEQGRIYFKMKADKHAIQSYQKAIDLKSDSPQFYFHLGIVFYQANQLTLAIRLFNKAIQLDDDYDLPHYGLALILEKTKRYKLALQEYEKVLDLTESRLLRMKVEKRIKRIKKLLSNSKKV